MRLSEHTSTLELSATVGLFCQMVALLLGSLWALYPSH